MAVLLPRRLLALVQLAVALWLVASTGCLCQNVPSYPTNPQPVPSYPTLPQPVPSYPTLPQPVPSYGATLPRPPPRRRPFPPCIGRRCTPP
ncbi:hypothetical protein C2845_PM12G06650 [Panicum miliaceum]|uniref:Extensin-like n=1 Tax=Panicum miliaceum TaxID=4540 RepID=A0A3L6QEL5_PANMI|nr:hypothetical protein C2845_PM12G06650 [Panicum miliaceum]